MFPVVLSQRNCKNNGLLFGNIFVLIENNNIFNNGLRKSLIIESAFNEIV